jgi:cysteine dioxygenase
MNKIIESINSDGFKNCQEILKKYQDNDWMNYVTINPNCYHKKKIYDNENFEIFIITWNVNQGSKIHDHADNGCYMLLLQGELTEEIYDNNFKRQISSSVLKEGFIGYIDNKIGFHRIMNNSSSDIAVSLHVYSPPNHIVKFL